VEVYGELFGVAMRPDVLQPASLIDLLSNKVLLDQAMQNLLLRKEDVVQNISQMPPVTFVQIVSCNQAVDRWRCCSSIYRAVRLIGVSIC
jgi:hypothetical protein